MMELCDIDLFCEERWIHYEELDYVIRNALCQNTMLHDKCEHIRCNRNEFWLAKNEAQISISIEFEIDSNSNDLIYFNPIKYWIDSLKFCELNEVSVLLNKSVSNDFLVNQLLKINISYLPCR